MQKVTKIRQTAETNPKVSVIIPVHNEGRLLQHTLRSVNMASEFARNKGLTTEVLIIADKASDQTMNYLKHFPKQTLSCKYRIIKVDYNDLAISKNKGIKQANGQYICLVEAGDLVSENWFYQAVDVLETQNDLFVVHPNFVYSFGAMDQIWEIKSSSEKQFSVANMVEANHFPTLVMGKASLIKKQLYRANDQKLHFVNENWLWNCDTLAKGIAHLVVPKTMLAKRYINNSVPITKPIIPKTNILRANSAINYVSPVIANNKQKDLKYITLKILSKLTNFFYTFPITRFIQRLNPRVNDFIISMRNETLHLFRSPEASKMAIPGWLDKEILSLHELDFRIFLSKHLREVIEHYSPQVSHFTQAYWYLANKISNNCDVLFIVPYLKNGGAEREIFNIIEELIKNDKKVKIKILATDPSGSPWAYNLNKKVSFIEPDQAFFQLESKEQGRLLASICLQLRPKKIHIVNSAPGYIAIQHYGEAIKENTQIFITVFSIDRTSEGRKTHMFTERMQSSIDIVDKVFTDNYTIINQLEKLMAIDKQKFSVHYQPVDTKNIVSKNYIDNKFKRSVIKVLWAGRIDRQKRPDILIKIAEEAHRQRLPVEFHVYGSSAFDDTTYINEVQNSNHIEYHGGFEKGLSSLPLEQFDIFLLTSEWEGMPNVLLEAIVGGMLVIAPNVGGVSETIKDNNTGYLVDNFDNIKSYVESLDIAIKKIDKSKNMIINAQNLIMDRHTKTSYEKLIAKETKYLN